MLMIDNMRSTFDVSASTKAGVRTAAAILYAAIVSGSPATAAERSPIAVEMQKFKYSVWAKFCRKGNLARAGGCVTTMDVRTESGQFAMTVTLIEREGQSGKVFRVVTPPNMLDLRYGTRAIVDMGAPVGSTSYACHANGCLSDVEAPPELIDKLKNGRTLQIQAINLAGAAVALTLPLVQASGNSFAGANAGPPMDLTKQCNLDTFYWCRFVD
jgi:invasion protein IalB